MFHFVEIRLNDNRQLSATRQSHGELRKAFYELNARPHLPNARKGDPHTVCAIQDKLCQRRKA